MPRLPRVSGTEVIRALERLGFEKLRQSGSHVVMRRGSGGCVVPLHPEVKVGTLAGVLQQAGVPVELSQLEVRLIDAESWVAGHRQYQGVYAENFER